VFTARYALSPYIKQIRFVFKGLTEGISSQWHGPSLAENFILSLIFSPPSRIYVSALMCVLWSCRRVWDFQLILFPNSHHAWLLEFVSLSIKRLRFMQWCCVSHIHVTACNTRNAKPLGWLSGRRALILRELIMRRPPILCTYLYVFSLQYGCVENNAVYYQA
jgi:hypothetical protein